MDGKPDGEHELHLVPGCVFEFYAGVNRCPDGTAQGHSSLNNRGHDDWPEITCWPKHSVTLTTGREYQGLQVVAPRVELNEQEKRICEILGLKEWELFTFLQNWTPLNRYEEGNQKPQTVEEVSRALTKAGRQRKDDEERS